MTMKFQPFDSLDQIGPDDAVVSPSDTLGLALLLEHGMGIPAETAGFNTVDAIFETPHHWCHVRKLYGFAEPSQNGFVSTLLPKSHWSKGEAAVFFHSAITESYVPGSTATFVERPAYS